MSIRLFTWGAMISPIAVTKKTTSKAITYLSKCYGIDEDKIVYLGAYVRVYSAIN